MGYKLAIFSLVALHAFTTNALPPCVCTRNLQPVCGSDGQTYSNLCVLECQTHKTGKALTMKKEGPCEGVYPTVCICTDEYKPVCGTDGNTYPNRCELLCKRPYVPDIDVVSEGACSNAIKIAEPPCTCPDAKVEVCGSDGNTYDNACLLNCATAKNPSLSIKSFSKCDDRIKVVDPVIPQQPPCICTFEMNEVCGSDGTTYANPCQLNCATAKNPSLSIKSFSKCDDRIKVVDPIIVVDPVIPQQPPCICTFELNQVCGSDGTTYANPCHLNCATAKNPSLSIKSQGKCDNINVVNPIQSDQAPCVCPRNRKPVCGSDGVTYSNECMLRCAGSSLARSGPC